VLHVRSAAPNDEIRITSPRVLVTPGMKLCLEALVRKGESFAGEALVEISLERAGGRRTNRFAVKEPNLPRRGGWFKAQHTFIVPADARAVRYHLCARFTGTLEATGLALLRK
jgi:hypothetical protein